MSEEDKRPAIPADLERTIMVEAGHRCAIPTCRHIDVVVHHIIPWATCKQHEYENLIALCPNCHNRADRGKIDRKALRMYKNNLRFVFDKYSQFEIDALFEISESPEKAIVAPPASHLLVKRILDSGFIKIISIEVEYTSFPYKGKIWNVNTEPIVLEITPEGEEFIASLSVKDIGY